MKRIVTAILSATEAFAIATAGLAFIAVPALLVWLISYGLVGDPSFVFGLIVSLWFFGHGVPLGITVDAATAASFGLPAEQITAAFSLFPLGFMLFTAAFAARIGWRLAAHQLGVSLWGAVAAVGTYFVMSWALSSVAPRPPITFGVFSTALMPTLVFTVGLLFGFVWHSVREDAPWFSRIRHQVLTRVEDAWRWMLDSAMLGIRMGGYALTGMLASGALVFSIRLAANYVDVVSLSQQLHVDVIGSVMLFIANIAYLPTMLIWTLSWIIGPGFSIGMGSSVSVISTQLGPIPSLPIFGVLPTGSNPWALAIINLILLSGLLAAIGVLRQHHREGGQKPTLREFAVTAAAASVLSGLVVVIVMWFATGSLGPGRLAQVGPHPWVVGGFAALEVLVGVVVGAWLTFVDWDRVVSVAKDKTQGIRDSIPGEAVGAVTQKLKRRTGLSDSKKPTEVQQPDPHAGQRSEWSGVQTQPIEAVDAQSNPDANDTVPLTDFEPWWGEKDDTI